MGDAASVDDVLARASARTRRVRLVLDGDLVDAHNVLLAELQDAIDHHGPDSPEAIAAGERAVEAEAAIEAAEVEFVFKAIGRGRWRKLIADHPPTDEQLERNPTQRFNRDTFPFVAIPASIVSPTISEDQLRDLEETVLDEAMFNQLWSACLDVNLGEGLNLPESAAARFVLRSVRRRSEQPSGLESVAAD